MEDKYKDKKWNTHDELNQSSAYDLISRHDIAQVSLKICKACFKFLKELSEF